MDKDLRINCTVNSKIMMIGDKMHEAFYIIVGAINVYRVCWASFIIHTYVVPPPLH